MQTYLSVRWKLPLQCQSVSPWALKGLMTSSLGSSLVSQCMGALHSHTILLMSLRHALRQSTSRTIYS